MLVPGVSDPGVTSGDVHEASLDVEWSGAVAPNATIIFVNGGASGVFSQALPYAIDNNLAPVISISYGNCEANWSASGRQAVATLGAQANSQGQTIVAAAGDSGAADCDYSTSTTTVITTATHGLAVDLPAAFPFVTGMGGTEFNEGAGNYWLPAPNGVDVSPSAVSYIPEMVWNDTSTTNGLLAGGGGASIYYSKPSWQVGVTPNDNARDVPDVSLNASSLHDGYLVCVQGSCVSGYRNPNNTSVPNALTVAGGTSAATPTFGGFVALINQYTNTRQGNINPTLYSTAATSPTAFHDITTGNNIVPCTSGSTGCPASGQIGYAAGSGYDQASGLGSVDAYNLVTAWGSSGTGAPDFSLGVSPTALAIAPGANGTSTLTLTPVNGFVPGSVTFTCSMSAALAGVTCTVGTLSGSNTATVTIAAASTATSYPALPRNPRIVEWWVAGVAMVCLLVIVLARRRRVVPRCQYYSFRNSSDTSNKRLTTECTETTAKNTPACSGGNCGSLIVNPRFSSRSVLRDLCLCGGLILGLGRGAALWSLRRAALGAILAALLLVGLSCGGGSSSGGTPTPQPESGTVTVTGTSTTATHSVTISVSVS